MVHSLDLFMKRLRWPCAPLAALCATALVAQAQPTAPSARPDPLDPKASVPALRYASSLGAYPYRSAGDGKPIAWREANDTVNRIGGWRAYAREAQQPEPPPGVATDKPAGDGHHGHHSGHKAP